jgi:hypothetical protein
MFNGHTDTVPPGDTRQRATRSHENTNKDTVRFSNDKARQVGEIDAAPVLGLGFARNRHEKERFR